MLDSHRCAGDRERMRRCLIAVVLVASCGPDEPAADTTATSGGPDPGGATSVPTSSATTTGAGGSSGGSSTGSPGTDPGSSDGVETHGPCPNGDECELCVTAVGASVCGPACDEYGPGFVRCPPSAVQDRSICADGADAALRCLIMCSEDSPCPDPAMICVPCPEPFVTACTALSPITGQDICAWPDP